MNKRVHIFLFLVVLLATKTYGARFLTKPYLQNLQPDAVTVMWLADDTQGMTGWVEIRKKGEPYKQYVATDRGLVAAYDRINRVRITDLSPATEYSYRVATASISDITNTGLNYADTIYSSSYKFTTPDKEGTHVSCKIFNDIHDYHNLFEQMLSYDIMPDYDFVFFNGDMLNTTVSETNILTNLLTPCLKIFASEKPIVTVRGNHEVRREWARHYFDYFDMGNDNKGYFSFRWGPVFFIALDSGEDAEDSDPDNLFAFDSYREQQAAWLRGVLESDERKSAAYTVVFMHIPTWTNTAKERHGMTHSRAMFEPLFHEYGIDVLISGHTHKPGIYPADSSHKYPIVIGGGYDTSSGSQYHPTMITIDANPYSMEIKIYNYSGNKIASLVIDNETNLPPLSGDLVLLRLGDGTSALNSSAAFPLFIDQYRLEDRKAVCVNSMPLPIENEGGQHRCLGVGSSMTAGYLTLSQDGRYLTTTGYDIAQTEKPVSKTAQEANRVVAMIDADWNIDTSTALAEIFSQSEIRSAVAIDGETLYVSGSGGKDANGGVWQLKRGGISASLVSSSRQDTRNVRLYDGQIYTSTSSELLSPDFEPFLSVDGSDASDFCMVNTGETEKVLYWITAANQITKYSLVGKDWVRNGVYENIVRPHALEARMADDCIQLFVVSSANISSGASKLLLVEDVGGYNRPISGPLTELVDATSSKTSLRGVAFTARHATGIENSIVSSNSNVEKILRNGHVLIRHDDKVYTILGQKIK